MTRRKTLFVAVLVCLCYESELRCNGECPDGWLRFRDHSCLKIFFSDPQTWSKAQAICRAIGKGSHLVKITSAADNDALSTLMGTFSVSWTGLNDIASENDWTWVGDQREEWQASTDYNGFRTGEPNNWNNDEDCVTFTVFPNGIASWNDFDCDQKVNFICQRPMSI